MQMKLLRALYLLFALSTPQLKAIEIEKHCPAAMGRIAVTADLHLGITQEANLIKMLDRVNSRDPDVFIIAGDIGESVNLFERALRIARTKTNVPIIVIPGNHDLWNRSLLDKRAPQKVDSKYPTSRELWERDLPEVTQCAGCIWGEGLGFRLGDIGIASTIGWYDYSGADPQFKGTPPRVFRDFKRKYATDAIAIDWHWTDPEFSDVVARPFLKTLKRFEMDPKIKSVIVITHVPILEAQMARNPSDKRWAMSNAYFGNLTLGSKVMTFKKVSHVVSGHSHVGRDETVMRSNGAPPIETKVIPSEYDKPVSIIIEPSHDFRPVPRGSSAFDSMPR